MTDTVQSQQTLKHLGDVKGPPFDSLLPGFSLLPFLLLSLCLGLGLLDLLQPKILLHSLRGQLHAQKPSHSFLISPLTTLASFCPSSVLFYLCNIFSLTFSDTPHPNCKKRTKPFVELFWCKVAHRFQSNGKTFEACKEGWESCVTRTAACMLKIGLGCQNHQHDSDSSPVISFYIENKQVPHNKK